MVARFLIPRDAKTRSIRAREGYSGATASSIAVSVALPPIRHEVSWNVAARLEDMDRAQVDVAVLYPTHVSSYCALRDGGLENAPYRAYHRWVSEFCARAPSRLK